MRGWSVGLGIFSVLLLLGSVVAGVQSTGSPAEGNLVIFFCVSGILAGLLCGAVWQLDKRLKSIEKDVQERR